ncbi:hypothetical protein [Azospirillum brasilense]|uniref:hypothetical protein n=1 Tax=Azospirillum brasilense TaxID=192 RepID=UPI000E68FDBD|nr:hypothetical protein [Azospirillum brasilense]NUB24638.1 hypothetical protein [Azospirillum brasilense]NUB35183.1 hypothetical protein [Azospirillum brasilense]RIW07723.1 hypothetical protein D2T81_02475 [Azospirillum brasilense]
MSSTDHCAASRLTRCMGAASLVIQPHPEEASTMLAFIEDAAGKQRSVRLPVTPDTATKLRIDADGQFFSTAQDARAWLFKQSMALACPAASSRSAA